jgi:hypothetical protein
MNEVLEGYRGVIGFETKYAEGCEWREFENFIERSGLLRGFQWLGARLYDEGWAPMNAGNISTVMLPGHHFFYITASGSHLSRMESKDIVYVGSLEVRIGPFMEKIPNQPLFNTIFLASTFPYVGDLSLATVVDVLIKQNVLDHVIEGMELKKSELDRYNFNLKRVLKYLGSKNMVKCFAEVVAKDENIKPSSETFLHGLIYSRRINDWVTAIAHCHAPDITRKPSAYYIPETDSPFEKIGYGTLDLAVEAAEQLGNNDFVLLRGHGPVALSTKHHYENPDGYMRTFEDLYKKLRESERYVNRRERWPEHVSDFRGWKVENKKPSFLREGSPESISDDLIIRMIRRGVKWNPEYGLRKAQRDRKRVMERLREKNQKSNF